MSGYGQSEYGLDSYGEVVLESPRIVSMESIDGLSVRVDFNMPMLNNSDLSDPDNYTFTPTFGAPVSVDSVEVDSDFNSVILNHSGTTLGGLYTITVSNVVSPAGKPLEVDSATIYSLGDTTSFSASPSDGFNLALVFTKSNGDPQPLLASGASSVGSYGFSTEYPISLECVSAGIIDEGVSLEVKYMTSVLYTITVNEGGGYIYSGEVLPTADTELEGEQIGSGGTSVPSVSGITLRKPQSGRYGWFLGDLSGEMVPGSSYKAEYSLNLTSMSITPVLSNETCSILSVSDGEIQIDFSLEDLGGSKQITVGSGTFNQALSFDWSESQFTLTLIRNTVGDFYSVILDGIPATTFPISSANGEASYGSGLSFVLESGYAIEGFLLREASVRASSTVYTSAWNFLHGLSDSFVGIPGLARNKLLTAKGPLVRGWGDSTPATLKDVEVRVNGVVQSLSSINPYIGEITLSTPLPLTPPGSNTVEIDYVWRSNPEFGLSGLNTPGLTLNNWMRGVKSGRSSVGGNGVLGAAPTARFPMGVVLNRPSWSSPKRIGHSYIGYQREYSALSNDPTTLLLNVNPHSITSGNISADSLVQRGLFDGQKIPSLEGWSLNGQEINPVLSGGRYTFTSPVGDAGVYLREVDLSLPTVVTEVSRFRVKSFSLYGVFTGIGVGVHDGRRLTLVGALQMTDGVKHLGVLLNADRPDLEESWSIGPSVEGTALSQSTLTVPSLPAGVSSGSRFRVPTGNQAGVYTVSSCGVSRNSSGEIVLTFSPELPEDFKGYGNGSFEIDFETDWSSSDLLSVRIVSTYPSGAIIAYVGGAVSGVIADVEQGPAYPAETALLIPALTTTGKGTAFWGSLSRLTENISSWDLVQYASNPLAMTSTLQGVTVTEDMTVLPQEDNSNPWFVTGGYGYSRLDGGELLLSSTAGSDVFDFEYSLSRTEPYISPKRTTEFKATLSVDSGVLGSGDAQMRVRDTSREVLLSNLLYVETATARSLINDLPRASLSGLQDPVEEGWVSSNNNTLSYNATGQSLLVTKASGDVGSWTATDSDPSVVGYEGMIAEARLQITEGVAGTGGYVGPIFGVGVNVGSNSRVVSVEFAKSPARVILTNGTGTSILSSAFDWDDGEIHSYRIVCDPLSDAVTILADDNVLGTTDLSLFPSNVSTVFRMFFGSRGNGSCVQRWYGLNAISLRPVALSGQTIDRTFGLWLGSDVDDIDNYAIPRSDGLSVKNSSLAAVPEVMDWQSSCEVRLYLDPTWGVGLYRPDLPAPPGATSNYTTETVNPSDAWVNVEYRRLPKVRVSRGEITFGSIDPRSISQQRWSDVEYRIRSRPYGAKMSPTGMVLNRATTFKSGDRALQNTPEVITIPLRTKRLAVVNDSAIFADRVFVVQDVLGAVIPSANWSFDNKTQKIVFLSDVSGGYVRVSFAPGGPVTKHYLNTRPIDQIVTVLNEGTPPVPKKMDNAITRSVVSDEGTGGDKVVFTSDDTSLYAGVQYCETTEGESFPIAIMSDGPGLGEGLSEIGLSGRFTTDAHTVLGGPGGAFKGSPTFKGSTSRLHGMTAVLGGGRALLQGVVLNSALLYPNARGPAGTVPSSGMGLNQDFVFMYSDMKEDTWGDLANDNVSPSGAIGTFGNGICDVTLTDYLDVSRIGPWGGIATLQIGSLIAGGAQLTGTNFILIGGSQIIPPVVTTITVEAAN